MRLTDIPKLRLLNQQISHSSFTQPEELVKYLAAVQSQDFSGAKWALGLRLPGSTDSGIEKAFNEGKILRTHALRPTWHFVDPSDIRWMVELNAPQVKRILSYYNKKLELTEEIFEKTNGIIQKALNDKRYLTRDEIKKELAKYKIIGNAQRMGHIVGWAELEGIICSGPRRGKQFTYALINDVAPKVKAVSRDEALSKLAEIFFKSRGPATINDLSKWSGLSMADSKKGLDFIKSRFESEIIEACEYFFSNRSLSEFRNKPLALLLPNYDEYISSYSDYSVVSEPAHRKNLKLKGNALFNNHLVIDGMVVGSWRRILRAKTVEIELSPFRNLRKEEREAIENETEKWGKFLGLKVSQVFKF